MSRRRIAVAVGSVSIAAVVLVAAFSFRGATAAAPQTVPTGSARIVRTNVIERQNVAGTLSYAGTFTAFNGASAGVVTWLPTAGSIVDRGRRLYELDDRPVPLFYGSRPAFRTFALGMSDGADIRELKLNLLALGFDNEGRLTLDDHFDLATRGAVKEWQRALGLAQTGTIPFGTIAFLPHAVRITGPASGVEVGSTVQAGAAILMATETRPAVLVAIDPGTVSHLLLGDRVQIAMPDGSTAGGRVAAIGRVATVSPTDNQSGGQPPTPTIPVTIRLRSASTGALDQAPVQVAITTQEERLALAVPISALLATPGGGYAIRVASSNGAWRLVPVTTGLFDDVAGRVAITSSGLRPGMRVQIPSE